MADGDSTRRYSLRSGPYRAARYNVIMHNAFYVGAKRPLSSRVPRNVNKRRLRPTTATTATKTNARADPKGTTFELLNEKLLTRSPPHFSVNYTRSLPPKLSLSLLARVAGKRRSCPTPRRYLERRHRCRLISPEPKYDCIKD